MRKLMRVDLLILDDFALLRVRAETTCALAAERAVAGQQTVS
jgi:DNA replication protein DnaC